MTGIKIVEEKVGGQWLITSPDLPGLYVAHADLDVARQSVPDAVEMLHRMAERRTERGQIDKVMRRVS